MSGQGQQLTCLQEMRLLGKLMKHEIQYNKMNYYFLFIYTRLGFKAETLDYFLSVKKLFQ